ncbi:MAG: hypothetical protein RLZZ188_1888 [Verrucomicrobiota bacterium]|jgi:glycosyltransferase involved in cell wall biosynthesis
MELSVIIPSHQPHRERLARTLAGLRSQTLPVDRWETVLVDNASNPPVDAAALADHAPRNLRLVPEPALGLTSARRTGFLAARGNVVVLVDDDNVLAPDYLAEVVRLFAAHPAVGALGGRSLPEFETPMPADLAEFIGLLACRDLGPAPRLAALQRNPASGKIEYPECAPIGAGMALRRSSVQSWIDDQTAAAQPDRQGAALTSGGDNDIVLRILRSGWSVGYFPTLSLLHLISAGRVDPDYLARLNRGIARSWVQVLHKHDANPWPPVAPWTVRLRQVKAWFAHRAWSGDVSRIRWQGSYGHFLGLADIYYHRDNPSL